MVGSIGIKFHAGAAILRASGQYTHVHVCSMIVRDTSASLVTEFVKHFIKEQGLAPQPAGRNAELQRKSEIITELGTSITE